MNDTLSRLKSMGLSRVHVFAEADEMEETITLYAGDYDDLSRRVALVTFEVDTRNRYEIVEGNYSSSVDEAANRGGIYPHNFPKKYRKMAMIAGEDYPIDYFFIECAPTGIDPCSDLHIVYDKLLEPVSYTHLRAHET